MMLRNLCVFILLATGLGAPAHALTLSSVDLDAAAQLGCVLADDALGYLNEDQFNERFDEVVGNLPEAQVDVIYAKALGYIDGLLFGVSSGNSDIAQRRLESYSNSGSCAYGSQAVRRTVSL
ncbi:hypothetical protein R0135_04155 [Congregibacter variabilis]|uniref:Uncharacterized protein n=1 Tax=Congregibacter variabilis TaxID=3081200 RepID=A0ABZ0I4B7_9GAMM|nr:hypothetical protein R0135_04155 [Congregibacter sp. IMCC43200]